MSDKGVVNWNGVFCPVVTPFRFDQEIYPAKVFHNISRLNQIDLAGYIVNTPAGEGEMLSFDERLMLLDLVAAATTKPKIVSTAEPGVLNAIRLIGEAAKRGYVGAVVESDNEFLIRCIQDRVSIPVLTQQLSAPPLANVVPYVYQTIYEAERSREKEAAEDWRNRLKPALAFVEKYGIAGVKAAMDRFGYYGGPPRLPRIQLNSAQMEEAAAALDGLRS